MEVKLVGTWARLADGRAANLSHCDLIEIVEDGGGFVLQAWNALQPQVEAYVLGTFKSRADADKALGRCLEALAGIRP